MANRKLILSLAGLIAVAAVAVFLINANTPCCAQETNPVQAISPAGYQAQFADANAEHLLIDVRTPEEFAGGHIEGAVNIPVEALASRLSKIPDGQPVIVYCRSGSRSATASRILADAWLYEHLRSWRPPGLDLTGFPRQLARLPNDLCNGKQGRCHRSL